MRDKKLTASQQAQLHISDTKQGEKAVLLVSVGDWTVNQLDQAVECLQSFIKLNSGIIIQWDLSAIKNIDSAGMVLFINSYDQLISKGCEIKLIGESTEHKRLYQLVRRFINDKVTAVTIDKTSFVNKVGERSVFFVLNWLSFITFLGESFVSFWHVLKQPTEIRFGSIVKNIEDAGVRAIPIIVLTSFLIGVVIAYQGAVQLEKFGANIFIVDMIALSITRELAPLITAIVVAGRTGSSYTAMLGVMKITEEVNAMRAMGFMPQIFLVQPRIIALILCLPLLIFLADIVGIAGGMLISNIHLGISYEVFIGRLRDVLDVDQVLIGLIKGPVFAWLIATLSCFYGLQVSNNSESIGRYTTISVVNTIFFVIASDALFSIVLTELGI